MNKKDNRAERFAREYILDLNGKQAAIRAGYSPRTAAAQASRLLTKSNVRALLAELTKKQADKVNLTAEAVLRELQLMGFSNMLDYIGVHNGDAYVDFSKLTREQAAAIQEITSEEYTEGRGENARNVKRTKFRLADKRGSLELLGKHLKLFNERVDLGNADDKPFEIVIRNVGAPSPGRSGAVPETAAAPGTRRTKP